MSGCTVLRDLRIVVHDYSGHPFQLQLSRELARRGHQVVHQYSADYVTGKGALDIRADGEGSFEVESLSLGTQFAKYSPARRVSQELRYGRLLAQRVGRRRPDLVIMCNVPLLAHSVANRLLRRAGVPSIFWHQDVYSSAIATAARDRLGALGVPVGALAARLEGRVARDSAAVVAISDSFVPVLRGWGVRSERIHVIPNWGALAELPTRDRANAWAKRHDLVDRPVALYSGTLGLKHNPDTLFELAEELASTRPEARLVVVSEGRGRDYLEQRLRRHPIESLVLLDFQPYEALPDVMASADVLIAILEHDASRYSVPSKILSYLCAGRPVLALIPEDNAAARAIIDNGAGMVRPPGNAAAAGVALERLMAEGALRERMGVAGRRYAEANFDVSEVATRFEAVIASAANRDRHRDARVGWLPWVRQGTDGENDDE